MATSLMETMVVEGIMGGVDIMDGEEVMTAIEIGIQCLYRNSPIIL